MTEPRMRPQGAFVGWDSVEAAEDAVERIVARSAQRRLAPLFEGRRIEIGARTGTHSDDAQLLNPPLLGHPWLPLREDAGEGAEVLDDLDTIVVMDHCGCHRRIDEQSVLCAEHLELLNTPEPTTRFKWSCPKCLDSGVYDFDEVFSFGGGHTCLEGSGPFATVVKLELTVLPEEEKNHVDAPPRG